MGYLSGDQIVRGAAYWLEKLLDGAAVPYSTFYDATEGTAARLAEGLRMSQEDAEGVAEITMDMAADQLTKLGVTSFEQLDSLLADEEADYQLTLLSAAKDVSIDWAKDPEEPPTISVSGKKLDFWDLDL